MISCSSNAGVIARSGIRERLSQTSLDNYRYAIIESDNIYNFVLSPPSIQRKFLGRHIYRYLRPSETFEYIGHQKGQAVEVNRWSEFFTINNKTLAALNMSKFYYNTDPDLTRPQWGIYNEQIILKNLIKHRNLYDNQIVFIDVRWLGFDDGKRRNIDDWFANEIGSIEMNAEKGNLFRVGTISKPNENYINEMVYLDIDPGGGFNPRKNHSLNIP